MNLRHPYVLLLSYTIKTVLEELCKEILVLVTDGGGDHNVTHASVQVALICLFLYLDLDMLVAMCTCPTQSWTNVTERVMSILNLALQHCATDHDAMDPKFESILKSMNNMTKLRKATDNNPSLKDAFSNSMHPVKDLLKDRFESMKLKDNHVQCFPSSSDERIKQFFVVIQERIHTSISLDNFQ